MYIIRGCAKERYGACRDPRTGSRPPFFARPSGSIPRTGEAGVPAVTRAGSGARRWRTGTFQRRGEQQPVAVGHARQARHPRDRARQGGRRVARRGREPGRGATPRTPPPPRTASRPRPAPGRDRSTTPTPAPARPPRARRRPRRRPTGAGARPTPPASSGLLSPPSRARRRRPDPERGRRRPRVGL